VVHGSSILTAVGETGLQLYKFGRVVTLTRNFEKSIYEAIRQNRETGLHTLLLLDVGMSGSDGLKILSKKMPDETRIVVACELGGNFIVKYGKINDLVKNKGLNKYSAVIILPGKLHFIEEEFLETLK
jgi:diphthine synthase